MSELSEYFRTIGKKGGENGTGGSKRRSPEHYRKMVEAKIYKQDIIDVEIISNRENIKLSLDQKIEIAKHALNSHGSFDKNVISKLLKIKQKNQKLKKESNSNV